MKKICTECGKPKDLNLFHRNHLKKDGRATKCADCLNGAGRQATKEKNIASGKKIKIPSNKIVCNRDKKQIFRKDCILDCNDACIPCKNRQERNIRAINSTTPEEDRELNYTSSFGNSGALAANEGIYNN